MTLKLKIHIISLSLLFSSFYGFSQEKESKEIAKDTLLSAAREIMTSAVTCTLITIDDEGRARARAMDPFLPDDDFIVWFGTNPKSRKVDQIKKDDRVTLYYLDHDDSGYVMIYGKADIVSDQTEKNKHWKEQWEAFYPNKQDAFVLIKVQPEWMEVISNTRGILGDKDTWEPLKVIFEPN